MPKNGKHKSRQPGTVRGRRGPRQRRLSVRSELRREPDLQKIARTVVALAIAQAEKEAAEQALTGQEQADA